MEGKQSPNVVSGGLFGVAEALRKEQQLRERRALAKLLKTYGISTADEDRWSRLALHLACHYIPDFADQILAGLLMPRPTERRRRGAPTKHHLEAERESILLTVADAHKARNPRRSDWAICQALAREKLKFFESDKRPLSAKTLHRILRSARRKRREALIRALRGRATFPVLGLLKNSEDYFGK